MRVGLSDGSSLAQTLGPYRYWVWWRCTTHPNSDCACIEVRIGSFKRQNGLAPNIRPTATGYGGGAPHIQIAVARVRGANRSVGRQNGRGLSLVSPTATEYCGWIFVSGVPARAQAQRLLLQTTAAPRPSRMRPKSRIGVRRHRRSCVSVFQTRHGRQRT